jgi:DNA polymerase-3 subunit beta
MKFIIPQEQFKKGISLVERLSGKSTSLPILNNILLEAQKNTLNIEATDLEIGIKVSILAKIEKEGKTTIPASLLSNFIRTLKNEPILVEQKEHNLLIETKDQKGEIKTNNPEDFPLIPQIKETPFITLPAKSFCEALLSVVDFASFSTTRPEISGIYFSLQKNTLQLAATDSFRLAEKTLTLPLKENQKEINFILPQKTSREIINVFTFEEDGDKELNFYFSPNQITIESLDSIGVFLKILLTSRLIEGEYPNYHEIIPKSFENEIILEKDVFFQKIKTAALFAPKTNQINLKIFPQKNKIIIFSQNPNLGQQQSQIPAEIKGKEKEIAFNYKFLLEGLAKIKDKKVIFSLSEKEGENGPALLKPFDDQSYFYIVMPMQG